MITTDIKKNYSQKIFNYDDKKQKKIRDLLIFNSVCVSADEEDNKYFKEN